MTTPLSVPDAASSSPRPLTDAELDNVSGGGDSIVLVPTEECPTCASGADPTVQNAQYQNLLAGDL